MNISNFISEISKNGVQHNSDFDVILTLPKVLQGKRLSREGFTDATFDNQNSQLSIRCESASIPGVALRTTVSNRYGVGVFEKMPYSAGFTEGRLSFILDKNSNITLFWYSWLNMITNFADTDELFGATFKQYICNYKDDFVATVQINKYDRGGNKTLSVILNRTYPISIKEQNLAWGDNNVSRLDVDLSFRDWYYQDIKVEVIE